MRARGYRVDREVGFHPLVAGVLHASEAEGAGDSHGVGIDDVRHGERKVLRFGGRLFDGQGARLVATRRDQCSDEDHDRDSAEHWHDDQRTGGARMQIPGGSNGLFHYLDWWVRFRCETDSRGCGNTRRGADRVVWRRRE